MVFGGFTAAGGERRASSDGFLLDRKASAWSVIPPAPFSEAPFSPGVVALNDSFIVLGLPCAVSALSLEEASCDAHRLEAAMYSPSEGAWAPLPAPPIDRTGSNPIGVTGIGVRGSVASFEVNSPSPVLQYDHVGENWTALPRAAGIVDPYCGLPDGSVIAIGGGEVSSQDPEVAEINTYVESRHEWVAGPSDPSLPGIGTRRAVCGSTATAVLEDAAESKPAQLAWIVARKGRLEWQLIPSPVPARASVAVGQSRAGDRLLAVRGVPEAAVYIMTVDETTWEQLSDVTATGARIIAAGESLLVLDLQESALRLWELS
jgi:hypothetical protein